MAGIRCRLCLSSDELRVPLFGDYSMNKRLNEMIYSCFQLRIYDNDFDHICYKCIQKLESFFDYKNLVMEAHARSLTSGRDSAQSKIFKTSKKSGKREPEPPKNKRGAVTRKSIDSDKSHNTRSSNNNFIKCKLNTRRKDKSGSKLMTPVTRLDPISEFKYRENKENLFNFQSDSSNDDSDSFKLTPDDDVIYKLPNLND